MHADDGIIYGRACQWCASSTPPTCYDYLAPGGDKFCERFVLLNQCERFDPAVVDPGMVPGWVPTLIAPLVALSCVLVAAFLCVLRKRRAPAASSAGLNLRPRMSGTPLQDQWWRDSAAPAGADGPPGETCVVCLERPRELLLYPCGHRVLCRHCTQVILTEHDPPVCPLCRVTIADAVRVWG